MNPIDGSVLIRIPGGSFVMGLADGADDEAPPHEIELSTYYLGKNEVTRGQYLKFCEATGRIPPPAPPWSVDDTHPVVNVTWTEAAEYCAWAGLTLPSEAQWEFAASALGSYPWGDDDAVEFRANCRRGSPGWSTLPVGSYPEGTTAFGTRDQAGNALEWCWDVYGSYQLPVWEGDGARRVPEDAPPLRILRGGSFASNPPDVCSRARAVAA